MMSVERKIELIINTTLAVIDELDEEYIPHKDKLINALLFGVLDQASWLARHYEKEKTERIIEDAARRDM